jgi:hypothetical protein
VGLRVFAGVITALLLVDIAATVMALHRSSKAISIAQRTAVVRVALRDNTARDLAAFEREPSERTLVSLQDDILGRPSELPVVTRLVTMIADRDLPQPLENALVVDLAKYDTTNTIRWLHELNVVARVNPTAEGPAIVKRTAKAAWLVLALRPNYGAAGIDLTRMDLRSDATFVGQGMNLSHVDFGGAVLSSGMWRGTDLTASSFKDTEVDGPLTCVRCAFYGRTVEGIALLRDGTWSLLTPGKAHGRVD